MAGCTDAVVAAIGDRTDLILVAQSLGAFTAPLVCERVPVELLVLVAGMVPRSRERGEDWPASTAYPGAEGADEVEIFYNDVRPDLAHEAIRHSRRQSDAVGREPWPLQHWPEVPTRYLLCLRDRMFPATWMRGVVWERLGIEPDEIDSGHCPALSRPQGLADRLEAYRKELAIP